MCTYQIKRIHVHITSAHTGVIFGLPVCLYLGYQGGSCVSASVCESEREKERVRGNSTLCQSVTAWIRFVSVCSAAIQKYGRNLGTASSPRLVELLLGDGHKRTDTHTHTERNTLIPQCIATQLLAKSLCSKIQFSSAG